MVGEVRFELTNFWYPKPEPSQLGHSPIKFITDFFTQNEQSKILVAKVGIEPTTPAFSGQRSTDELRGQIW